MRNGFIGLGNIGILIARDLLASGDALTVHDLMPSGPEELGKAGARIAKSPAEVAENADNIGICVLDAKDVHDVMEGPGGILSTARPGLLVAIHSTISIEAVADIAAAAKPKGVRVVDAPVSRDLGATRSKGIVFMVGGAPEDIARAELFVAPAALKVVKTGELGTGMAAKICNNLLTYTTMVMANDAMRLAEAAGLDVRCLADVTSNNGVAGPTLTSLFMRRVGTPLPPQVSPKPPEAIIGLGGKDLDCALEVGHRLGIDLPSARMSRDAYRQTVLDQWTQKI